MAQAKLKTTKNEKSVSQFLARVTPAQKRST
jgi:hypothetical protein